MSNISLLARGSFAVLVLGAALSATAQTQTPQTSSGTTSPGSTAGAGATANTAATIDAAFKRADTNADGKLSAEEAAALPAIGDKFKDLDTDKDGALSSAEFSSGFVAK